MTPTQHLQWRAGHVPGQTRGFDLFVTNALALQWRAGHVPGQTGSVANAW